jgi:hypothetical protein
MAEHLSILSPGLQELRFLWSTNLNLIAVKLHFLSSLKQVGDLMVQLQAMQAGSDKQVG